LSESRASVLIVNRGEIANRAILACQQLGLKSILFCTPADQESVAFDLADQIYQLENSEASKSYLNLDCIQDALKKTKPQYLYPGYGFHSENHLLARLCEDNGVGFVGPHSRVLQTLANKAGARELALQCNLFTLKLETPIPPAAFPVLMKATSGGGGRGHQLVDRPEALAEAQANLQSRAERLFGSAEVLFERYLPEARHVELQIFTDLSGHTHFLGTRDCTIQRNYQKLIEEGPAPSFWADQFENWKTSISHYLRDLGYRGPGTLEFLCDKASGKMYFLELNCRIQVEHTVTEQLSGLDLVRWQLQEFTSPAHRQEPVQLRGHALELRIYAEDVHAGFLPSTGQLGVLQIPHLPQVRWDGTYKEGQAVTPHYDPLIGKLIVSDSDRQSCITRALQAVNQISILGVQTNLHLLRTLLKDPAFLRNDHTTGTLDALLKTNWSEPPQQTARLMEGLQSLPQAGPLRPAVMNLWRRGEE